MDWIAVEIEFENLKVHLTEAKSQQSEVAEAMTLNEWIEEADVPRHPFRDSILEYQRLEKLFVKLEAGGWGK